MSDDVKAAAERLLHEVDVHRASESYDGDSLLSFEQDIETVARYVLAQTTDGTSPAPTGDKTMNDIETPAESQACRAAMERLAECGWSLENADNNHALIRMWIAGRDWQRAQAADDASDGPLMTRRHRQYTGCPKVCDCWLSQARSALGAMSE